MTLRDMLPNPSQTVLGDCIAEAAYFIWLREGMGHGRDLAHWLQAEQEQAKTLSARARARTRRRSRKPREAAASSGGVYRLRFLGPNGAVKLVVAVPAANDAEALDEAEHFRDGRPLEVWHGTTRIGAFAAGGAGNEPYAATSAGVSSSCRTVAR